MSDIETWCVYILFLDQGKIYVGASLQRKLDERIRKHCFDEGANWTKTFKPLPNFKPIVFSGLQTKEEAFQRERNLTITYMRAYGVDNVRGHRFVMNVLPNDSRNDIMQDFIHDDGRCLGCYEKGHYISKCKNRYFE